MLTSFMEIRGLRTEVCQIIYPARCTARGGRWDVVAATLGEWRRGRERVRNTF